MRSLLLGALAIVTCAGCSENLESPNASALDQGSHQTSGLLSYPENAPAGTPPNVQDTPNCSSTNSCTVPPANSCSAISEVCAAYARNMNRLPDQAGALYWHSRVSQLKAMGLSSSALKNQLDQEMSGNAEVVHFKMSGVTDYQLGLLANGAPPPSPQCTQSVDCRNFTGFNPGAPSVVVNETVFGWDNVPNVIAKAYVNNGIRNRLDLAGLSYWAGQYQQARGRGRTPDQAAQDVINAIGAAK